MNAHRLSVFAAVLTMSMLSVLSAAPATEDVLAAAKAGDRAQLEELLTGISVPELQALVKGSAEDLSRLQLASVLNTAVCTATDRPEIARAGFSAAMEAMESDPATAAFLMSSLTTAVYEVCTLEDEEALATLRAAAEGAVGGTSEENQATVAGEIAKVAVAAAPADKKTTVGTAVQSGAAAGAAPGQRAAVRRAASSGAQGGPPPQEDVVQPTELDDVPVSGQ